MFSPINRIASICVVILLVFTCDIAAQKKRASAQSKKASPAAAKPKPEKYYPGTVVDERLSVLRITPGLYGIPLQRMRRGRTVLIYSSQEADGVLFYSVAVPPDKRGWVQAEAVVSARRRGDDERLLRLIRASDGFEQIERGALFLETFPDSPLRPALLLYLGDLLEDAAQKLSFEAHRRLDKSEMEAGGAPSYSYFLNYAGLDRYRKLGIGFVFDQKAKYFHYNGERWRELIARFPGTNEAIEAGKRLDELKRSVEFVMNAQ